MKVLEKSLVLIPNHHPHLTICVDGHLNSDPITVANGFNDFFTSIADTVRSKIGPTKRHFSHYLKECIRNSIFLDRINPAEVLLTVNSLSLNKSLGPNSISPKIIRLLRFDLSGPLSFSVDQTANFDGYGFTSFFVIFASLIQIPQSF